MVGLFRKDKKEVTVTEAFKTIFKEGGKPQYIWTDKGKEYYNRDFKELLQNHNITLYSTENQEKSSSKPRCESNTVVTQCI